MTYYIRILPTANKQILRLQMSDYRYIAPVITSLSSEPRPQTAIKLFGSPLWRVRARDFRIIYSIDDRDKLVTIVRVARRNENTYDSL